MDAFRAFLSVLLVLLLAGQSVSRRPSVGAGAFDLFQAHSRTSLAADSSTDGRGFSVPPLAAWSWYEGQPDCSLSPIGANVDRVVRDLVRQDPARARVSNEALLTTRRNAIGPTLVDSAAIFKAAGRLFEAADYEIDLVSFAMEPDAEPYLELVRGFERRLESGRPMPRPFRIRIYTDHVSVLFSGGRARPKARSLLAPWLRLFTAHQLDPRAVQIEIYVHAHGAFLYDQGGRYSVHDKLLVVDGSYVHIGGANPQSKNNYAQPERDSAVVVMGDVATSAMAAFDTLWSRADFSCAIEKDDRDYRASCADRPVPSAVIHDAAIRTPQFDRIGLSPQACLPMILLSKGRSGFENVGGYSNPWAKGLLAAVAASRQSVMLSSPNMNAPPLQGALVEAATDRDVTVRLLLPDERNEAQVNALGGYGSNARSLQVIQACAVVARAQSQFAFDRLAHNFQAGWWVAEGAHARFTGDGPGCFHTKFASFDDRAAIVGSGNLDDQSFFHSSETSLFIDDALAARALSRFLFQPEWTRAERIDLSKPLFISPSPDRDPALRVLTDDARGLCAGLGYSLR